MDPIAFAQYAGFVVAALILIWGIIIVSTRYYPKRKKISTGEALDTWVRLDSTRVDAMEEQLSDKSEENREEHSEEGSYTRAQQNGHYSESKKML
jgi:cell division protein FtsL